MPLEAGSVFVRIAGLFDKSQFDKADKAVAAQRANAKDPIMYKIGLDDGSLGAKVTATRAEVKAEADKTVDIPVGVDGAKAVAEAAAIREAVSKELSGGSVSTGGLQISLNPNDRKLLENFGGGDESHRGSNVVRRAGRDADDVKDDSGLSLGHFIEGMLHTPGGFMGMGKFGLGSMVGLGPEHAITAGALMLGTAGPALAGGGLLAGGWAAREAVGGGADALVGHETRANIEGMYKDVNTLNQTIAQYGKHSKEAAEAQKLFNYQMSQFGSGPGEKAELGVSKQVASLVSSFKKGSQEAQAESAGMMSQVVTLAQKYLPLVISAAQKNLGIVDKSIKPLFSWLEGPQGKGIFTSLENDFSAKLPGSIKMVSNAVELFLKIFSQVDKITEHSKSALGDFFSKENAHSAESFDGTIKKLLGDFHMWMKLIEAFGKVFMGVMHDSAHEGDPLIKSLTDILDKMAAWEDSTKGSSELHSFFEDRKTELDEILKSLGPLLKIFFQFYMDVVKLVPGVTDVFKVLVAILTPIEKLAGHSKLFNDMFVLPMGMFLLVWKRFGWEKAVGVVRELATGFGLLGDNTKKAAAAQGAFNDENGAKSAESDAEGDSGGLLSRIKSSIGRVAGTGAGAVGGATGMGPLFSRTNPGVVTLIDPKYSGLGEEAKGYQQEMEGDAGATGSTIAGDAAPVGAESDSKLTSVLDKLAMGGAGAAGGEDLATRLRRGKNDVTDAEDVKDVKPVESDAKSFASDLANALGLSANRRPTRSGVGGDIDKARSDAEDRSREVSDHSDDIKSRAKGVSDYDDAHKYGQDIDRGANDVNDAGAGDTLLSKIKGFFGGGKDEGDVSEGMSDSGVVGRVAAATGDAGKVAEGAGVVGDVAEGAGVAGAAPEAATGLAAIATAAAPLAAVAAVVVGIGAAIVGLAKATGTLGKLKSEVLSPFESAWKQIQSAIEAVLPSGLKGASLFKSIGKAASDAWDAIKTFVGSSEFKSDMETFEDIIGIAAKIFSDELVADVKAGVDIMVAAVKLFIAGVKSIVDIFEGVFNVIKGLITGNGAEIEKGFGQIGTGIVTALKSVLTVIPDLIVNLFKDMLHGVEQLLGIASPSTVFAGIGKSMVDGIMSAIDDLPKLFVSIAGKMVSAMVSGIKNGAGDIGNAIKSLVTGAGKDIGSGAKSIVHGGKSIVKSGLHAVGLSRGGTVPGREFGLTDRMTLVDPLGRPRAKMAGDESVYTRQQRPEVDRGLKAIGYGGGSNELWSKVNTPHSHSTGGSLSFGGAPRGYATGGALNTSALTISAILSRFGPNALKSVDSKATSLTNRYNAESNIYSIFSTALQDADTSSDDSDEEEDLTPQQLAALMSILEQGWDLIYPEYEELPDVLKRLQSVSQPSTSTASSTVPRVTSPTDTAGYKKDSKSAKNAAETQYYKEKTVETKEEAEHYALENAGDSTAKSSSPDSIKAAINAIQERIKGGVSSVYAQDLATYATDIIQLEQSGATIPEKYQQQIGAAFKAMGITLPSGWANAGASAAAAQSDTAFQNFQQGMNTTFGSFGSNFVKASANPYGTKTKKMAGLTDYGAAAGAGGHVSSHERGGEMGGKTPYGGVDGGGGPNTTNININQHFGGAPPNPHTYSSGLRHELGAALG